MLLQSTMTTSNCGSTTNNNNHAKPNPCRSVRACVRVTGRASTRNRKGSAGGVGFVTAVDDEHNTIDVRYPVEERNSQDIVMSRVSPYNLESTMRTTKNSNREQGHGLLSAKFIPSKKSQPDNNNKKRDLL